MLDSEAETSKVSLAMEQKNKKGQLSLGDAPAVVLIVGLVFLIMATIALVSTEFNDSITADITGTAISEATTQAEIAAGHVLDGVAAENSGTFVLGTVRNTTNVVTAANFSLSSAGTLTNTTTLGPYGTAYQVNYTYLYAGVAANVTTDLNTEIGNNTSIAGIVLTISLVGIVLTILVGIFVGFRNRRI